MKRIGMKNVLHREHFWVMRLKKTKNQKQKQFQSNVKLSLPKCFLILYG